MKIYIAGRVTGLNYSDVERKFNNAEMRVRDEGHDVVNPVKQVKEGASKSEAMGILLPLLTQCDAILLLEDWIYSEGAQIEAQTARYCGKHIIDEDDLT